MCCLLAAAISLAPDNVRGVNEAQCVCVCVCVCAFVWLCVCVWEGSGVCIPAVGL